MKNKEQITLQDFLQINNLVNTGGEAKFLIQNGQIKLNNQIETRRRKKLFSDDIIEISDKKIIVK